MSRTLNAIVAGTAAFLTGLAVVQASGAQQPNIRIPQQNIPLPNLNLQLVENWSFEHGLTGWEKTGTAFNNQPTYGDNVAAKRIVGSSSQFRMPLGGDYWTDVTFPIGHKGNRWIGTYENRPGNTGFGQIQGDAPVGALTSKSFTTDKAIISFLIGGGEDITQLSVSLYERINMVGSGATACGPFTPPTLGGVDPRDLRPANTPQLQTAPQIQLPPGTVTPRSPAPAPPATPATPSATVDQLQCADGLYKLVAGTPRTGLNTEIMRREWWSIPAAQRNKPLRIRIVDNKSTGWGHINVDDFRFETQEPTRAASPIGGASRMAVPYTFRAAAGAQPAAAGYVDWDAPVWGVADLHTHPVSNLGFGKKLVYGRPDGDINVEMANCNHNHGGWGLDNTSGNYLRSIIINLVDKSYMHRTSDTKFDHAHQGGPAFVNWPHFSSATHQQMRWEWIKRAHEGGLRLMVALTVNNQLLADGMDGEGAYTVKTSDKVSGDEQIQAIKDFVAWTKRQPGGDFLDIVTDPAQMRDSVRRGKLAIIIGMEVDNIGNFNRLDVPKSPAAVAAEIRRLHGLGVRYVFPIHVSDNVFGGAAIYDDLFNLTNRYAAVQPLPPEIGAWAPGTAFQVETAPDPEITFRLKPLLDGPAAATFQLRAMLAGVERLPTPFPNPCFPCPLDPISLADQSLRCEAFKRASGLQLNTIDPQVCGVPALEIRQMFQPKQYELMTRFFLTPDPLTDTYRFVPGGHRNAKGLTTIGEAGIREMMRLGMIIDIDHMSEKSADGTMRLAEAIPNGGYPVVSGHTGFRAMQKHGEVNENQRSDAQLERISRLGGMMGIGFGYSVDEHNEHMEDFTVVIRQRGGRQFTSSSVPFGRQACAGSSNAFAQSYLYGIEKIGAVSLGSDINGLIAMPGPRFGPLATMSGNHCERQAESTRVVYGSAPGQLVAYRLPGKTWDINTDGFSHYGMLPDFFQDMKMVGINPQDMSPLFRSAEAFASTWTKAVERSRDVR